MTVASNFVLVEYRFAMTLWAGRYLHAIRRGAGPEVLTGAEGADGPEGAAGLKLAAKTVHLVNAGGAIPTMAFLI